MRWDSSSRWTRGFWETDTESCGRIDVLDGSYGSEACGSEVSLSLLISPRSYRHKTCKRNPEFAEHLINYQWQFLKEIMRCDARSHSEEPKNMWMQECQTHIIMLHSLSAQCLTSTFNLHKHKESLCPWGSSADKAGNQQNISGIRTSRRNAGNAFTSGLRLYISCPTSQLRERRVCHREKTEKERSETVQQVITDSAMCFFSGDLKQEKD